MNIQGFAIRLWIAVGVAGVAMSMLNPIVCRATEPKITADTRTVIALDAPARNALFQEMRSLLVNVQLIIDGIANNNLKAVVRAARASGTQSASEAGEAMERQLPKNFTTLGMSMHKEFDAIAADAEKGGDAKRILTQLAVTMQKCAACHVSYQVRVKAQSMPKK